MNSIKNTAYAADFNAAQKVASELLAAFTDESVADAFCNALRGDPTEFVSKAQRFTRSDKGRIANGSLVLESFFLNGGVNTPKLGVRNTCGTGLVWTCEAWPRSPEPDDGEDIMYVLEVFVPDEPGYEPDLDAVRRAKSLPGVSWEDQQYIEE